MNCCDCFPYPAWGAVVGGDQIYWPQADVPGCVLRFPARCPGEEAAQPAAVVAGDPNWSQEANWFGPQVSEPLICSFVQSKWAPFVLNFVGWLCSAGVWATFPRQEEAIRFCKAHAYTNVFSYQDHLSGQRRFLVSTYDEFWKRLWPCYICVPLHFWHTLLIPNFLLRNGLLLEFGTCHAFSLTKLVKFLAQLCRIILNRIIFCTFPYLYISFSLYPFLFSFSPYSCNFVTYHFYQVSTKWL